MSSKKDKDNLWFNLSASDEEKAWIRYMDSIIDFEERLRKHETKSSEHRQIQEEDTKP